MDTIYFLIADTVQERMIEQTLLSLSGKLQHPARRHQD